jgi:hypothetical protein
MSQQAQVTRWRFQSDFAGLVVYHEGHKIAHFMGGEFETSDRAVADALRGFDTYCYEVAIPPIPIVIEGAEAAISPAASESAAPAPAPRPHKPARAQK